MGNNPAFLFYVDDYLGGTMGFSLDMHGGYLLLLCYQFNNGHFAESNGISIVGEEMWEKLSRKFKKDSSGMWYNQRLDDVQQKRREFGDSQRQNAMKRWGKSGKPLSGKKISVVPSQCDGNAVAMPMDMPNGSLRVGKGNTRGGAGGKVPYAPEWKTGAMRLKWTEWLQYRKDIKKPYKSDRGIKGTENKLREFSNDNELVMIRILEQSMNSEWTGVFELRESRGESVIDTQEAPHQAIEDLYK